MTANLGPPGNLERISIVCDCGKKLVANAAQSGKRLKCLSCGHAVVVPPARAAIDPRPRKGGRRLTRVLLLIALWSLPVVVAVGGVKLIRFDAESRKQARIDAANTEVREVVKGADGWLKQGSPKDAEDVEHRLTKAMAAKDVSDKANADAVLEKVRTRRAELAADSVFDSAKTKLDAKALPEAIALLNRYVADPGATKKSEARQLLADCELATSDWAAIKSLMAMSDEQFAQFKKSGKLDDRQIAHANLAEMCTTTLRRNLETANRRREENKIAEANRQKSERLALAAAAISNRPSKDKVSRGASGDAALRKQLADRSPPHFSESRVPDGWRVITTTMGYDLIKDVGPLRPEIGQTGEFKGLPDGYKIMTSLYGSPLLTRKSPGEPGYETPAMKRDREAYDYHWAHRYDEPNSPPNGSARVPGMFKESDREAEERRRQEWENARVRINRVTR